MVSDLTADCPKRGSGSLMERCDILFRELLGLFPPVRVTSQASRSNA